jgi:hypothetical protein
VDLLFTQDHNNVYNPDSLIYWGGPDGIQSLLPELWYLRAPFSLLEHIERSSARITRLPTEGGGRAEIADLNQDGFLDIVLCNFMHNYRPDQNAYVYWGSAQGFEPTRRTELPAYWSSGVAVADLNSDGMLDIVLANKGDERNESRQFFRFHQESYVYWGDVKGFDESRRTSIPTISATDVADGDFNGDRFPDLAFVNHNSRELSVYLYFGDGTGVFTESRRQVLSREQLHMEKSQLGDFGFIGGMQTLNATEIDGDPYTDLVVAGTDKVVIFRGSASGLEKDGLAVLPARTCKAVAADDLNGDGFVDVVVANQGKWAETPPDSTIFWGSRDGFSPENHMDLPTAGAGTVQIADFDGNGYPDILFGNSRGGQGGLDSEILPKRNTDVFSYIYWGSARGFHRFHRSEIFGFGVNGSAVADLNEDGALDIFLSCHLSGGDVLPSVIFWGDDEHYYSSANTTFLTPGGLMEFSIADLDDDGHVDIVFLKQRGIEVLWGRSEHPNFKERTALFDGPAMSNSVADLNQDGFLDILLTIPGDARRNRNARGAIVWGNGNRFEGAETTEMELSGRGTEANSIADLNKDGHLDLIFPLGGFEHSEIWWGSDQGYLKENASKIKASGAPHAAVADLDNDGWLDLMFCNAETPSRLSVNTELNIYWGSPEGFADTPQIELEAYTSLDAAIGDFDRNGYLDLAVTNYRSDTTRELPAFVYWGGPGRTFSEKNRTLLPAASSSAVSTMDLDKDGWLEVIVSNHQREFDHAAGTNIFWGSPSGFSDSRITHLPTLGVHLDSMVDPGHIYTREYEWDFAGVPVEAPNRTRFSKISWESETDPGTGIKFQVRSARAKDGLANAEWLGPNGPESYFSAPGQTLTEVSPEDRWLQYRAVFTSQNGANTAILTEVTLSCETVAPGR